MPGLIFATGMPMIDAIGTSLLAVGSFGLATAVNDALTGLVAWDTAGEFIAGGIVGGLLGLRLACHLVSHRGVLNQVLAGLIFVVAAHMLYRNAAAFL